jgi:hypothetical protein
MNEIKYLIVELGPYKIGNVLETHNRKIIVKEIDGVLYIYDNSVCVLTTEYKYFYRMINSLPEAPKNLSNLQKIMWWYIYSTYKMKVRLHLNDEMNIVIKPSHVNLAKEYE